MDKLLERYASALAAGGAATELELLRGSAWAMIAAGAASFVALSFVEACYGKYSSKAAGFLGPQMNGKLAWVLQELPSLAIPAGLWAHAVWVGGCAPGGGGADGPTCQRLAALTPNTVLLAMFLLHYANRTLIFPLRIRGGKPTPFLIFAMAFAFCVWNGATLGRYLTAHAAYPPGYLASPRFGAGVGLFFAGMAVNWHSDHVLINLRKPGETGYKIPRGGAFELVSGANFFGEIMEWAGFALAANALPATAFAAFTFCNIGPRGAQHHAWYRRTFKDYPRNRRAVIPFVW